MLRQMERSTIHLLAKRGRSQRQIAEELGRNRRTIARVLQEPVEQAPAKRQRRLIVDPYRSQIEQWIHDGITAERMLELARADPERPYPGGHSVWRAYVRRVWQELAHEQAVADVQIRSSLTCGRDRL